jgi:hypothetical protein
MIDWTEEEIQQLDRSARVHIQLMRKELRSLYHLMNDAALRHHNASTTLAAYIEEHVTALRQKSTPIEVGEPEKLEDLSRDRLVEILASDNLGPQERIEVEQEWINRQSPTIRDQIRFIPFGRTEGELHTQILKNRDGEVAQGKITTDDDLDGLLVGKDLDISSGAPVSVDLTMVPLSVLERLVSAPQGDYREDAQREIDRRARVQAGWVHTPHDRANTFDPDGHP